MADFDTLNDSGERRTFASGAQRDRGKDKTRPDLVSPFFLQRLGWHMMLGARKYSANNWAKGMPNSEFWASLNRHVAQAAVGDTSEDHLSAIAFNVMGIIHNQEMKKLGLLKPEFDDWPVNWGELTGMGPRVAPEPPITRAVDPKPGV
jgi:hypothetical protein